MLETCIHRPRGPPRPCGVLRSAPRLHIPALLNNPSYAVPFLGPLSSLAKDVTSSYRESSAPFTPNEQREPLQEQQRATGRCWPFPHPHLHHLFRCVEFEAITIERCSVSPPNSRRALDNVNHFSLSTCDHFSRIVFNNVVDRHVHY